MSTPMIRCHELLKWDFEYAWDIACRLYTPMHVICSLYGHLMISVHDLQRVRFLIKSFCRESNRQPLSLRRVCKYLSPCNELLTTSQFSKAMLGMHICAIVNMSAQTRTNPSSWIYSRWPAGRTGIQICVTDELTRDGAWPAKVKVSKGSTGRSKVRSRTFYNACQPLIYTWLRNAGASVRS